MNDRFEDEYERVPPDMAELHEELSSIRYEERPSFGPELEAELARRWREAPARRPSAVRALVAAVVTGLLLAGVAVPQARASLIQFVVRIHKEHVAVGRSSPPSRKATAARGRSSDHSAPEATAPLVGKRQALDRLSSAEKALTGPSVTFPELLDRPGAEAMIRRHYPLALQRAGVGGTVRLRLWVDSVGRVDFATIGVSSGVPDLDRAALNVAPSFRFRPARRFGVGVGTWVEFNVHFEPKPTGRDSTSLPKVDSMPEPEAPDTARPDLTPEWQKRMIFSDPASRDAGALLRAAVGDDALVRRLGPIEGILEGEPPAGMAPTRWRAEVGGVLQRAMARDPDNPAPFLALGRLRRKQGLRDEARTLFERGLGRALREDRTTPPALVSALYTEQGELLEESWLSRRNLGTVSVSALRSAGCAQAPRPAPTDSGPATAGALITWDYLCPDALAAVWRTSFEPDDRQASADLEAMMTSYRAAVHAQPANVDANVGLLLALADQHRWRDLLDGARAFVQASDGHPDALLLSGLALERLRRPEEAEVQFQMALKKLPPGKVAELQDVRGIAKPEQLAEYATLRGVEREAWLDSFWAPLDPILSTALNERRVEHMARAAYAYLRFGSTSSDPANVWIRYGRPDRVRVIATGPDVRTEFWDYGTGPDITFRRVASSTELNLTSEGRAYLDDLEHAHPYRYDARGRLVVPLSGQVARFRGRTLGETDVEIETEVPEAMASGSADSLDLSVFQLGPAGRKVGSVAHRVPATRTPIFLQSVGSSDVRSVAVEIMDRETGTVAALRAPAGLGRGTEGAATASDLLITSPEVPPGWAMASDRARLHAETLAEPVSGDEVGAYFELYDLPVLASWYQLRAELRSKLDGRMRSVLIRPVGREGFRSTWEFRPVAEGPMRHFLIVNLANVPTGSYTLRIIADMPEVLRPVVVERPLDVRH